MLDNKSPNSIAIKSQERWYGPTNLLFCIICLLIASYFASLRFHFNFIFDGASLSRLVDGNAYSPYQYRVLIPWVIKSITFITAIDPKHICYFAEVVSTFLLLIVFRYFLSLFFKNSKLHLVLSITILYPLVFHYILWRVYPVYYYPSDIPSVLFFTLGLIFIYRQNWYAYYILFIVATFNRETTCFLTFIYLFTNLGKTKIKPIGFHIMIQFVIWASVKYVLYLLFAENPITENSIGSIFDDNFWLNIKRLKELNVYPAIFSITGFLWIPILIWHRLISDSFLRRSLIVSIPFFTGMMFVGNIIEIRIFGEMIPVVLTAFLFLLKPLYYQHHHIADERCE